MTAQAVWQSIIENSCSVVGDGTQELAACDIWDQGHQQRGLIGRSLVVACIDNTFDGISIYLNLVFGDAVPVFFPRDAKPELLGRFIRSFQPNYLVLPNDGQPLPSGFDLQFSWGGFGVYAAQSQLDHEFHEDLCLLATTSGSTGSPKVVRQSFANLAANTHQIVSALGLDAQSKAITSLPISYTFGMSVVNCQVSCGGSLVVSDLAPTQKGFLELLLDEGVTVLSGVPQTFAQLNAMRFFRSRYAAGVQTYIQAGGKLPTSLEDDLTKKVAQSGQEFFVMYGQAEATTRMSILPAHDFGRVRGSVGPALKGGRFSVADADGMLLGPRTEGEIWYQGPNVSLGYASSFGDLNAPDTLAGTLKTGDVGYVDEKGYLFVTGRLKRFAKIKGHSVNLDHLEEVLQSALQVDVRCLERGDVICVFHTADLDSSHFEAALLCETNLMMRDVSLHKVSSFPQTASGKVQYARLAEMLPGASNTSLVATG